MTEFAKCQTTDIHQSIFPLGPSGNTPWQAKLKIPGFKLSCHRNDLLRWPERKIKITKRTLFFFHVCFQSAERKINYPTQVNLRYVQSLPDSYILRAFSSLQVRVILLEICEPVNHFPRFKGRNNIWVWKLEQSTNKGQDKKMLDCEIKWTVHLCGKSCPSQTILKK